MIAPISEWYLVVPFEMKFYSMSKSHALPDMWFRVCSVNQAFAAKLVYASELADPPKHKRIGAKFYS